MNSEPRRWLHEYYNYSRNFFRTGTLVNVYDAIKSSYDVSIDLPTGPRLRGGPIMTKGRWPEKGFGFALPIAEGRGPVWVFEHATDNPFSFIIVENGRLTAVGIQKAKKLQGPVANIEAEHSEVVAGMYAIPRGGAAATEIWFIPRRGAFPVSGLEDAGLMEIDLHGLLFVNGKPSAQRLAEVDNGAHSLSRGPVAPGAVGLTGWYGPADWTGGYRAGGTGPGSGINPRSPIIRWLAKRNAARKIGRRKNR